jgi:hypothetical protein
MISFGGGLALARYAVAMKRGKTGHSDEAHFHRAKS